MPRDRSPFCLPTAATGRAPQAHDEPWAPEVGSGIQRVRRGFSRARYVIEHRAAVLHLLPAPTGARPTGALPDTQALDLYEHAPHTLPERTYRICECPACLGPGSNCSACEGSGRLEAWIEVRTSRYYRVQVSGADDVQERHPNVAQAEDFDRGEWQAQLLHQAWYQHVPPQLAPALRPALDAARERVLWAHVQTFLEG